ncbi:PREDICTED: zinc finger protein 551-like [Vollenhovia emeryi]|uniref:zinc finger protein 551-like n=1 Tax=Vollenhovia emeryi TaxID=411798 RepID=UPI0005F53737|nr:PREDICTED: zinc finger protein 551-like [Vollenhovia emeryi]
MELWGDGLRNEAARSQTAPRRSHQQRLQQHLRKTMENAIGPHDRRYHCPKCEKSFSQSYSMYRHYKYECDSLPRYQCPYCGHVNFRPIVLQKYHGVVRNSRHTLRLQAVNRRGYPCPRCARVFRTPGGMSRHYRLECVDMPRFKCPHCDMRSKYTQAVYRHIRAKHRNMELRFVKLY